MTNGVTSSAKILFFGDSSTRGCGATVRFIETGEPCMMSIAQSGIWVKKSRYGLFGAVLYYEKNTFANARRIGALAYLFPDQMFPDGVTSHALRAFFNAILHCRDATQVSLTLNDAIKLAERKAGCTLDEIPRSEIP